MKFYPKQNKYYCGIDLHTNKMYVCILDEAGEIMVHRNIKTDREVFIKVIEAYREDIVVFSTLPPNIYSKQEINHIPLLIQ